MGIATWKWDEMGIKLVKPIPADRAVFTISRGRLSEPHTVQ